MEFKIQKGINLSHWLSQRFGWSPLDTFMAEDDIVAIKNEGFDHVRLPIDEEVLWDEQLEKNEKTFQLLHTCISWCKKHSLRIVVDLHIIRSHHFNAENDGLENKLWTSGKAQKQFLSLWRDLQGELKDYPTDFLAYEIMNEPVADDHDDWNKLIDTAYNLIRENERERPIIIGSNMWQTPETFPHLRLPENVKNIILSCHFYEPMLVTHYQAYWVPTKYYDGPISYPGLSVSKEDLNKMTPENYKGFEPLMIEKNHVFDSNIFKEMLQPAIELAQKMNFQLYCSEFGCLPSVPRDIRLKYYQDIISVFLDNNIAFCHWDYKGDFGVREYNRITDTKGVFDSELLDVILTR